MMKEKVELMCPAGNFESLNAAIKAGATSIYFGVGKLNMRARSANFEVQDLEKIVSICNQHNVRTYLTLNTIMYDEDLNEMKNLCKQAKKAGVSAIIASDISVITYAHEIGLEVHISTQANVSNIEAVKFYSKYADVIVLARELSLAQIKKIIDTIKKEKITGPKKELIKIEVFAHGAMCIAISGKCYMSLATYNFSANRGECLQTCRRKYRIFDEETGVELIIDNKYVMSPKDLCTINIINKLLDTGIKVLKIEGRARGPEYVYTVTKAYKEAIDAYYSEKYSKSLATKLENELKTVFNRGFWENGYYLGKKLGEWSNDSGNKATKQKIYAGKVINFFKKPRVAEILLEAKELKRNDEILIIGKTTGIVKHKIKDMQKESLKIDKANKKDIITIKLNEIVRKNDKVYLFKKINSELKENN